MKIGFLNNSPKPFLIAAQAANVQLKFHFFKKVNTWNFICPK